MVFIIENSWIVALCNRFLGVNIDALTIGPLLLFCELADNKELLQHESIHAEQYKDLGYIGFPIVYVYDYVRNILKGMSAYDAYASTRAEKEAYQYESDLNYLKRRKRWMWLRS